MTINAKEFIMQTQTRSSLAAILFAASLSMPAPSAVAQQASHVRYQEIRRRRLFGGGPGASQAWEGRCAARGHLAAYRLWFARDPKNLVYFLQEDRAKPGHFIFYEIFASQADFEAHNAMPYVQEWFAKLPELAEGGVEVMRMAILSMPKK